MQWVEKYPTPGWWGTGRIRTCDYWKMGPTGCSISHALQIFFGSTSYLAQKQHGGWSRALPSLFASLWKLGQQNLSLTTACHQNFTPQNTFFIFHGKLLKWCFLGTIRYKHKYGSSNGMSSFHSCICAKWKKTEKQRERKKSDPWLFDTQWRHWSASVLIPCCLLSHSILPDCVPFINHGWIFELLLSGWCFIFLF